jgi:AraC-like DNA-binding protein/DNA-binding CsgD family transcriptional regulator
MSGAASTVIVAINPPGSVKGSVMRFSKSTQEHERAISAINRSRKPPPYLTCRSAETTTLLSEAHVMGKSGRSAPRLPLKAAPTAQAIGFVLDQYHEIGRILASARQSGAFENDTELHIVVADLLVSIRAPGSLTADPAEVRAAGQVLTESERSIIELIAAGRSDEQIARILGSALKFTKARVKWIFRKLLAEYRNPTTTRAPIDGLASDRAGGNTHDAAYNLQVARAEAWIDTHLTEAISVEDIASALGVCTRTLRLAFRSVRGCSPLRAVHIRRLDRVRAALAAAKPGATVTDIATSFGFFELGRFSVRYRKRFDEKPSETLARRVQMAKGAAASDRDGIGVQGTTLLSRVAPSI